MPAFALLIGGLDSTWERVMNAALALMIEEISTYMKLAEVMKQIFAI